jgi:hypothetical protein
MDIENQVNFNIGDWIIASEAFREKSFGNKKKYRARKIKSFSDESEKHNIGFMINHIEMLADKNNFRLATEKEIKIEKIKLIFKIPSRGLYT